MGLSDLAVIGEDVVAGEPLARVHAATKADAERAVATVRAAYRVTREETEEPPLIHARVG